MVKLGEKVVKRSITKAEYQGFIESSLGAARLLRQYGQHDNAKIKDRNASILTEKMNAAYPEGRK